MNIVKMKRLFCMSNYMRVWHNAISMRDHSRDQVMLLVIFLMSLMISLSQACRVDMCSREYSSVLDVSQQAQGPGKSNEQYCSLLHAYQHCIRSVAKSCRGHLEFHTIQTLLKTWKLHHNCSGTTGSGASSTLGMTGATGTTGSTGARRAGGTKGQRHHQAVNWNQRKSGGFNSQAHRNYQIDNHQQRILQHQQRLQQCLSSAYNYTINYDINSDTSASSAYRDERVRLVTTNSDYSDSLSAKESGEPSASFYTSTLSSSGNVRVNNENKRSRSRIGRRHAGSMLGDDAYATQPVKAGVPLHEDDGEEDDEDDEDVEDLVGGNSDNDNDNVDEDEDESSNDNNNNSENVNILQSRSNPSLPSSSNSQSSHSHSFSPPIPSPPIQTAPSPALTCLIYGDPHLRTFNNQYQTCKCQGAWPLIDHPLFAVQITNSRLKGSNPQVTGVSKVTVLVRQFTRCGIHNDLLYEAESESSSQGLSPLPVSFIGGISSTVNNLIRITSSTNNNVVTIHLDHIGARVYIGQFSSSNYLNVIIKFRSATSAVKQQLVLNSISANSLCKSGCPRRERIDIRNILTATGVNIESVTPKETNYLDEFEDTRAILANDATSKDKTSSSDPCVGLYGYYRISCLYDVAIKGVNDANNACRFAQSFDEMRSLHTDNNIMTSDEGENPNNHENGIRVEMLNSALSSRHHNIFIISFTPIFSYIIFFLFNFT